MLMSIVACNSDYYACDEDCDFNSDYVDCYSFETTEECSKRADLEGYRGYKKELY